MKLNEISDIPGALKAQEARRPRHRLRQGQDRRARREGPEGAHRRRVKGFEGGQMPLHRRLPKRGFRSLSKRVLNEVNLDRIQTALDGGKLAAGKPIDIAALVESGVCRNARSGVKLLGRGELKAKLSFEVEGASKAAVAAIEKAGGSVKIKTQEAPAA